MDEMVRLRSTSRDLRFGGGGGENVYVFGLEFLEKLVNFFSNGRPLILCLLTLEDNS